MNHAGGLHVTLVGGKLDGDKSALVPNGSLSPPQQLSYLDIHRTADGEEACWLVYGIDVLEAFAGGVDWPEKDKRVEYRFMGAFSIDYSRKL